MPFAVIVPQISGTPTTPDEVVFALYGKGEHFTLTVKLGAAVMRRLRWVHDNRVVFEQGFGTESGLIRVTRTNDPRGGFAISPHNYSRNRPKEQYDGVIKCLSRRFDHYVLPTAPRPQEPVPFQVDGDGLLMLVPAWMEPGDGADLKHWELNRKLGLGARRGGPDAPRPIRGRKAQAAPISLEEALA